jgi:hypothetical protein
MKEIAQDVIKLIRLTLSLMQKEVRGVTLPNHLIFRLGGTHI